MDLEDSTLAPVSGDSDSSASFLIPTVLKLEDRMTALQASHDDDTHAIASIPGFDSSHLRSDCCSVVLGFQGQLVTDQSSVVSTLTRALCTCRKLSFFCV